MEKYIFYETKDMVGKEYPAKNLQDIEVVGKAYYVEGKDYTDCINQFLTGLMEKQQEPYLLNREDRLLKGIQFWRAEEKYFYFRVYYETPQGQELDEHEDIVINVAKVQSNLCVVYDYNNRNSD